MRAVGGKQLSDGEDELGGEDPSPDGKGRAYGSDEGLVLFGELGVAGRAEDSYSEGYEGVEGVAGEDGLREEWKGVEGERET